jgi:hypothetical protein
MSGEFTDKGTEYAKVNGYIRLDLNYDTLADAKGKTRPLWIQECSEREPVYFDLSLDQAEWLIDKLQYFISLLENNEDDFDPNNDPQEVPNDIDFDDYKE